MITMKINQLKAGVILSYMQLILGNIISIMYTPVMLRILGQSEYGLYNLSSSTISYLGLLNFGLGSAYMRYYSRYKVDNDKIKIGRLNGMFIIIYSVIAIIAAIAGLVLISNAQLIFKQGLTNSEISRIKILMVFMLFNMTISFPLSVFNSNIIANERFFFQQITGMINTIINPFVMLPVLLLGYKSIGMVIVTTILGLISNGINIYYCINKLKINFVFGEFDFKLMKEMLIFSSYIFLNMIVDQINWSVDKFLLGMFKGSVAVAIYGIGAQFNTYYLSFSTSISNVFIPKVNRLVYKSNDKDELTKIFTKVGRIQFIVLSFIMVGFLVFGKFFIEIWAGNNYYKSYYIAVILMLPVSIPLIQNLGLEIQKAKNMHKFRSVIYFIIAIGNICMSIPLCKQYGEVGCAIGTAISLVIGNGILMNWYYYTKVEIDIIYFWKNICRLATGLIVPIIIGIGIRYVGINSIMMFLVMGIVFTIIFFISMYYLGMNEYERQLFKEPFNKLKLVS